LKVLRGSILGLSLQLLNKFLAGIDPFQVLRFSQDLWFLNIELLLEIEDMLFLELLQLLNG